MISTTLQRLAAAALAALSAASAALAAGQAGQPGAPREIRFCTNCGTVQSVDAVNAGGARQYVMVVRYESGETRSYRYANDPGLNVGEKVKDNNGVVVRDLPAKPSP